MRFTNSSQRDAMLCSRRFFFGSSLSNCVLNPPPPSTLGRFKDKLRDVSDRIEDAGYMGSNEDAEIVSQLMDEIRAVTVDCQVSSKA